MTQDSGNWLRSLSVSRRDRTIDGLVYVDEFDAAALRPEQVSVIEKARTFGAQGVFFEASRNGYPPIPQALVFLDEGPGDDKEFSETHRRLWSWGGVPLAFRKTRGLVQLFRCAHKPDFLRGGKQVCNAFDTLGPATEIARSPWWDDARLRNGTLWDDPDVAESLVHPDKAAHKAIIDAVSRLYSTIEEGGYLKKHLRRRLLVLALLIAFLMERGVFEDGYFSKFMKGATQPFEIFANGQALIDLLEALEQRFNGGVFSLTESDKETLRGSNRLQHFAELLQGCRDKDGHPTLWRMYSFQDLPVEVISHIYQLFVDDPASSIYTPPFLVRLMLDEAMSWERVAALFAMDQVILDPSCGSGIFLVEAYKRLVLYWRSQHDWKRPGKKVLKELLQKAWGVDKDEGATELTAFSLYLALCDALEPAALRTGAQLFPPILGTSIQHACFFDAKAEGRIKAKVGIVLGNPPFRPELTTSGAERSYQRYGESYGTLPDKQLAYLFLHESMEMLEPGGIISMLQQYSFLYNQQSVAFRHRYFKTWNVREILDLISVRGLFKKGKADTKVLVVVAEARPPDPESRILHATFRRSGRVETEQGFDLDYYDMHWLPRELPLSADGVWRAGHFGGGRVLGLMNQLSKHRTLQAFAKNKGWELGEGYIEAKHGHRSPAAHITGKEMIPSTAIGDGLVDRSKIRKVTATAFRSPYTASRYTPPMLLIREHMDLDQAVWTDSYLTYTQQIVGLCAKQAELPELRRVHDWMRVNSDALRAYVAVASPGLFIQKATAIQADDIYSLPYPVGGELELSPNDHILIADILEFYREYVRKGDRAEKLTESATEAIPKYSSTLLRQINAIYKINPLRQLPLASWPGVICVPFAFGDVEVDWSGTEQLRDKIGGLLTERGGMSLNMTRIARIYDGPCLFILKPDRYRFWMQSVALRDGDEILADLRAQGF